MPRHPSSLEDKSTIVARNIDNSQYDIIKAVSDNINAVNSVNDHMSNILITNANLTNINITATNIDDVNSVVSNIATISNVNDELVMLNNINSNMSEILLGNYYANIAATKANEASISAANALNSEVKMLAITSLDYAGFQVIDGELVVSYDDVNALPPQLVDGEFIVSYGV